VVRPAGFEPAAYGFEVGIWPKITSKKEYDKVRKSKLIQLIINYFPFH